MVLVYLQVVSSDIGIGAILVLEVEVVLIMVLESVMRVIRGRVVVFEVRRSSIDVDINIGIESGIGFGNGSGIDIDFGSG